MQRPTPAVSPSSLPTSPTSAQVPTYAPTVTSPTAFAPTATSPTTVELISWDLFSDENCAIEFTAVDNHSAHGDLNATSVRFAVGIPNGACVDLHPGPLVAGLLPNASARVICEDPGYADSPNRVYLYQTADCSGPAAITKEGAGDGCQLGQAPVNSGKISISFFRIEIQVGWYAGQCVVLQPLVQLNLQPLPLPSFPHLQPRLLLVPMIPNTTFIPIQGRHARYFYFRAGF